MPTIGVDTEAESRKPVSSQEVAAVAAPTSAAMAGMAGTTTVWARENEMQAVIRTAMTSRVCTVGVSTVGVCAVGWRGSMRVGKERRAGPIPTPTVRCSTRPPTRAEGVGTLPR